jgi:hypothetical protein
LTSLRRGSRGLLDCAGEERGAEQTQHAAAGAHLDQEPRQVVEPIAHHGAPTPSAIDTAMP